MDLEPLRRINPCGYAGLEVIQLSALAPVEFEAVESHLIGELGALLGYSEVVIETESTT
jgi:lipoyl(octanoyl) transferase